MKDILVYGAGGYGREVACIINRINNKDKIWNFCGFIDDGLEKDSFNEYYFILPFKYDFNNFINISFFFHYIVIKSF